MLVLLAVAVGLWVGFICWALQAPDLGGSN